MKKGFYPHLAFDGIRKNKRLYLPYILTQIGMIMMFYIVIFLRYGESLKGTFGDKTVNVVLMFGGSGAAVVSGTIGSVSITGSVAATVAAGVVSIVELPELPIRTRIRMTARMRQRIGITYFRIPYRSSSCFLPF